MIRLITLLLVTSTITHAAPFDDIADKVFLGELYPSGNAYLQAFRPGAIGGHTPIHVGLSDFEPQTKPRSLADWPKSVSIHGLSNKDCPEKTAERAEVVSLEISRRAGKGNTEEITYVYLPAKEGMDDSHNQACRLTFPKNPKFTYADREDFFATVSDYCYFDDSVARYVLRDKAKSDHACQILAVTADLKLEALGRPTKKTVRPLTPEEKRELAEKKKKDAAAAKDCTTEQQYEDDAEIIATAKIGGTPRTIRLSRYSDAGCAGHLSTIYILDVLEGEKREKSYVLTHYQGPI